MAYNEYEDYLDEIRRRKEAERFAIEQAEIDRDMRIKGFFLFAIFAGIVYFFVRHPKLIVTYCGYSCRKSGRLCNQFSLFC